LDFVVSCRQDEDVRAGILLLLVLVGVVVVDADLVGALGDDLAKKPRMLCCLRVDVEDADADAGTAELAFLN
jgi:hypothetical protein